jgi:hypothetical protein
MMKKDGPKRLGDSRAFGFFTHDDSDAKEKYDVLAVVFDIA